MKPKEPVDLGEQDLIRSRLDQILDMGHAKVVLANTIVWEVLASHCSENYADVPKCRGGHPALPTRQMAGLHILKYADDLSDEGVCAKFVENPYYQFFCGELFFSNRRQAGQTGTHPKAPRWGRTCMFAARTGSGVYPRCH